MIATTTKPATETTLTKFIHTPPREATNSKGESVTKFRVGPGFGVEMEMPTNGDPFEQAVIKVAREGSTDAFVEAVHRFPALYNAHMRAKGIFR